MIPEKARQLKLSRDLVDEKARISIYDPEAMPNAKKDLADIIDKVEFVDDAYEACKDASAFVVLTDWLEFKELDYKQIHESMYKPFAFEEIFLIKNCCFARLVKALRGSGVRNLLN